MAFNTTTVFHTLYNLTFPQTMLPNTTFPPTNGRFAFRIPYNANAFKLFMAIMYGIIFLIGMPGNILVIMSIIRVPKMRSVKNLFIANLAVGDLINITWCLPTSLLSLYVSWPYGHVVCKYIFPVADVIIGNTVFTMVCITLDRFRAIVHPFTSKPKLRTIVIVILLLWVISYLLIGVPLVIATEISTGFWVKRSCNLRWKNRFHEVFYRIGTSMCLFVLPFCVILFCFVRIKTKLVENIRFAKTSLRGRGKLQRAKKNQRLIKMLFVIFVCFTCCFLPINVLLLTITFHPEIGKWAYTSVLFQLAIALLFLNSIMNPIILYKLSHDFKVAYHQQLKCLCPNTQNVQEVLIEFRRRVSTVSILNHSRSNTLSDDTQFTIASPQDATSPKNLEPPSPKSSQGIAYRTRRMTSRGTSLTSSSILKSVTWSKDNSPEQCELMHASV